MNPVKNSVPDRRGHGKQITVPLNSHDDNNDYGEQRQNVSRSLNCMVKGTMYFTYVQNYITIIQNGYLHCTFDPQGDLLRHFSTKNRPKTEISKQK